jgi:hypothetical protein
MERNQLLIAFLLGVCVALGVALVVQSGEALPKAHAQAAAGGELFAVTGTGTTGQSRDVIFLVDASQTRLLVYEYKDGRLTLGAVRNFEFETRFQEWSPKGRDQVPSVKDMRDLSEQDTSGGGRRQRR